MITEIALKIIIWIVALLLITYLLLVLLKIIEVTKTEKKDEKFLNYLKKNDPDKYESIAIKYQDNPVRMKKVLHAYQQELKEK